MEQRGGWSIALPPRPDLDPSGGWDAAGPPTSPPPPPTAPAPMRLGAAALPPAWPAAGPPSAPGHGAPYPPYPGYGAPYPYPYPVPRPTGPSGRTIGLVIGAVALVVSMLIFFSLARAVGGMTDSLETFGALGGGLLTGEAYGDNATLDALWDGCTAGDFDACDELYFRSEVDSEYEHYGDSCGRRNEPGGLCSSLYGS